MTESPAFRPPLDVTYSGSGRVERHRNAKHLTGDNQWIRDYKNPVLTIICTARAGRRLFGIIFDRPGRRMVKLSRAPQAWADSESADAVPLEGWRPESQEHHGLCPCGRMHAIDLRKLREAVARLESQPAKARTVDVERVAVD